jgi:hypothetical protein
LALASKLARPNLLKGEVSYYYLRCDAFPEGGKLVDLDEVVEREGSHEGYCGKEKVLNEL